MPRSRQVEAHTYGKKKANGIIGEKEMMNNIN